MTTPPLTATEAGELLRISGWQVVNLCRSGDLRATKPGKSWLIQSEDLQAYINAGYNDAPVATEATA